MLSKVCLRLCLFLVFNGILYGFDLVMSSPLKAFVELNILGDVGYEIHGLVRSSIELHLLLESESFDSINQSGDYGRFSEHFIIITYNI